VKQSLLDTFKILTKMPMEPLWTKIQDGGHPQTKSLKMKKYFFFINLASGNEQKLLKKKGKKEKKFIEMFRAGLELPAFGLVSNPGTLTTRMCI